MKAVLITVVLSALVLLAIPVLANNNNPEIEVMPAEDKSDSAEVIAKTPLRQTIADIKQQAVDKVLLLHNRTRALSPGSEAVRELQTQIRTTKFNCEVAILEAILADAYDRGDMETKAEAELALDHLLHPENYPTQTFPSNRPAPGTE